jgi:diguanylate cyclase (GGDEF)-like protein/PAS domain S-box-containing protein
MTECNLDENLEYFKIILKKLPVAISVSDTNGKIIYVNDEFKELYNITNEAVIGFKREEFYIQEDRDRIKKAVEKCKLDGKSFCEAVSITKLPVMINYKLIKVGNKEYISGTATNISEIKEREEELNFIFENSRAAMVLTDETARWIKVNRAFERDSGFSRNELIGKTLRNQPFVTEKTIKALNKFKSSTIEKRVESQNFIDVPAKNKNGEEFIHSAYQVPFASGKSVLYTAIDVTKDRQYKSNLKKAIFHIGSVLKKAAQGNFSAKVNLTSIADEYRPIGENLNKMIANVQRSIEKIKNKEEELNFIFENSKAAMLLLDKEGRWIKVNKAFERDSGFNRQELLNKKTPEQPCTTERTITALKKLWEFVINQKREAETTVDIPWLKKDGSTLIHSAYEVPYGIEGEGRLYTAIDVTKDREYELNLKKAIYHFGYVLKEIASGNLSVKVDLDSTSDEYKPIGEDINKMITSINRYISEIEKRDLNLKSAISIFGTTLYYAASGDLSKKVDIELLPDEYKSIGENLNQMIESLDKLLTTDYLTNLLNRRAFYQHMSVKERYGSLIMLDLDNFKYINDTYGHDVGDETLKTVAQIVLQNTRDGDLSVRLGGDEILLYLPRTNIDLAVMIAERIRILIEKKGISASFGIAYGKLSDELIKIADNEMYKAKKIGKNKISIYNHLMSNKSK